MTAAGSRTLQTLYLALTVVGYLVPGVPTLLESARSGNLLFWTEPQRTMSELFVNLTSTAFALDLTMVVIVAFIWMAHEARRVGISHVWPFWLLTMLFGLGGTLPLFLFFREKRLDMTSGPAS